MDSEERDQREKEHRSDRGDKYEKPNKNKNDRGIREDVPKKDKRNEDPNRNVSPRDIQRGDSSADPNQVNEDIERNDDDFIDTDEDESVSPDREDDDF